MNTKRLAVLLLAGSAASLQAQTKPVAQPGLNVPQSAMAYGDLGTPAIGVSATNPLPVLVTGGITFDGTVTGGTEYTEDVAAPANPSGGTISCRRKDTLSTTEVSADGDWISCQSDNQGQIRVRAIELETLMGTTGVKVTDGSGALTVDGTVAATQSGSWSTSITGTLPAFASTPAVTLSGTLPAFGSAPTVIIGSTLPAFASTPTVNLGTIGGTATSALQGTGNTSLGNIDTKIGTLNTNFGAIGDSASATGSLLAQGRQANVTLSALLADTSAVPITDNSGSITVDGTVAVSGISGSIALPTGAATETTLSGMSGKLPTSVGAKTSAASLSVTLASDSAAQTSLTSMDGKLTTINNGVSVFSGLYNLATSASGTNLTTLTSSSGCTLSNIIGKTATGTTGRFLQFFSVASGSVTVGTTTPVRSIPLPDGGASSPTVFEFDFPGGMYLGAACSYAITTTATGATGVNANDVAALSMNGK